MDMSARQQRVAGIIFFVIVAVVSLLLLFGHDIASQPTDAQCQGVGWSMPPCEELAEREAREGWQAGQEGR